MSRSLSVVTLRRKRAFESDPKGHSYSEWGRSMMAKTNNALKVLERLARNSASIQKGIGNARINMDVAQMIYDVRTEAGLTQRELRNWWDRGSRSLLVWRMLTTVATL